MKTTILYFMTLILFMGCSSDESKSQSNDLFGKWKLMAFVNEANGTIIVESDFELPNEIIIDFKEDFKYEGSTVRNTFSGNYAINDLGTILTILDGVVTEVNDTEWGYLFFDNLHINYNPSSGNTENDYVIINDVLKIYYAEKEYMKFVKIEP